ncbi:glutamate carboxypeptidase II [Amniculicola lignicola CBS 123094]|uniref:Glutamate carboxypeptidase II n=1 Tax=Amniculicola lignicola CBS 123094 TaxID=1392246 RepID=A0A6A5VWN1_9PLEO|nr:glutamate carboxypeptidase II [Amniculicola lignicola CBS 123094]
MFSRIPIYYFLLFFYTCPLALTCEREFPEYTSEQEFARGLETRAEKFPPEWTKEEEILSKSISAATIKSWASYYTHGNHVAGLNKSQAEATAKQWNENGIKTELVEYEVWLNYPVNGSLVLEGAKEGKHVANLWEDKLPEDETTNWEGQMPGFHGYSASGDVKAEYIYVGLAHKDDFARLKQLNINLKGKIALAKYGGPFRGTKVKNAEREGMVGVVIFSDPGDDGPQVAKGDKAYPEGRARHPSSIQRGSVAYIDQYVGDPTTPGYASKPGVKRTSGEEILPKIPSLPISYRDALPILRALDGYGTTGSAVARSGWVGGLSATYSTGPAPNVTLSLSNKMEGKFKLIWNVIGIINGTESDETIILGNHRDAWMIGGAADPNGGSAILVESTKAFGELVKTGWKPRRNIVFASWDAEEYALIGSTEWVEEFAPWLKDTAFSYINVDTAVNGALPAADATPELRGVAQEVMKKVIYGTQTLYDSWRSTYPYEPESYGFGNLGSSSDYTTFLQYGIGALHFQMARSRTDAVYHYHSNYDSFHWMTKFIDPDFKIHTTVASYLTLLTYQLATSPIMPYDFDHFARNMDYNLREVVGELNRIYSTDIGGTQNYVGLTPYVDAVKNLQTIVKSFAAKISATGFADDSKRVKDANRRMKGLLRAFVDNPGLLGRPFYKALLWAPNRDDGYRPQLAPGIIEALYDRNLDRARDWVGIHKVAFEKAARLMNLTVPFQ